MSSQPHTQTFANSTSEVHYTTSSTFYSSSPAESDGNIDLVRYFCASFYIIVLISSLVGDSIILAASVRPNAIKLNKFIVTIMQHIAVCDLTSCFSYVLPHAASLIENRWVLEGTLDEIRSYVDGVTFGASTMLICLLSTSKFFLLKCPMRTSAWTARRAHVTCAIMWLFVNIIPAMKLFLDTYGFQNEVISNIDLYWMDNLEYLRVGIYQALPLFIIIITTVLILCHIASARRVSKRCGGKTLGLRGVATVVITVLVYFVSVFPHSCVYVYELTSRRAVEQHLRIAASCFTSLNIMSNIYVYYLTIPSLRVFIKVDVLKGTPPGSRSEVNQGLLPTSQSDANAANRRNVTADLVTVRNSSL